MKGYLLDTNVVSETLRLAPAATVKDWLRADGRNEHLFLSVVTIGELRRGTTLLVPSAKRTQLELFIEATVPSWFGSRILPVTQAIAERWGVLDGQRQLAGRPLNIADGLIAAAALEHDLTLVTRNVKDFAEIQVGILNPWETD